MDYWSKWIIGVIGMSLVCLALFGFYKLTIKPTMDWYDKCDKFEKDLMENIDKDRHLNEFFELAKFSWHRSTGERLKELAIRCEMKYDVKILK